MTEPPRSQWSSAIESLAIVAVTFVGCAILSAGGGAIGVALNSLTAVLVLGLAGPVAVFIIAIKTKARVEATLGAGIAVVLCSFALLVVGACGV